MNMQAPIVLIPAGRTFRTHGLRGELEVEIDELLFGWIEKEKVIFFHVNGSAVPFWIQEMRNEGRIFIRLEDMGAPEAAKTLAHKEFFIDRSRLPAHIVRKLEGRVEGPELEGYALEDETSGQKAEIVSVEEYPSQLMAEVLCGERKFMIPLHPDLIIRLDRKNRRILVRLPEGIFDLS